MFSGIGFQEMIVIGIVAVLLFGRKLPEVARNAGKAYHEFRKQIGDLQSTFTSIDVEPKPSSNSRYVDDEDDHYVEPAAPRFETPPESDED